MDVKTPDEEESMWRELADWAQNSPPDVVATVKVMSGIPPQSAASPRTVDRDSVIGTPFRWVKLGYAATVGLRKARLA